MYKTYVQYRKKGTSTWQKTSDQSFEESGSFNASLTTLDNNSEYEFRVTVDDNGTYYYTEVFSRLTLQDKNFTPIRKIETLKSSNFSILRKISQIKEKSFSILHKTVKYEELNFIVKREISTLKEKGFLILRKVVVQKEKFFTLLRKVYLPVLRNLLTMDKNHKLEIKGELIEGEVFSLTSDGNMTVFTFIEGLPISFCKTSRVTAQDFEEDVDMEEKE